MPAVSAARKRVLADFIALPPLDAGSRVPLQTQLYHALRDVILSGALKPGTRLPSTRALSEHINLSRNTILNTYLQLWAEGYLAGRKGSGTYVADELPEQLLKAPAARKYSALELPPVKISKRGHAIADLPLLQGGAPTTPGRTLAFCLGTPALDAFPTAVWSRLIAARWKNAARSTLVSSAPNGVPALREAVATYLISARGVRCHADQVLIVSGSQQALSLTAQVLIDSGDSAWVEDPGYPASYGALIAAGARVAPIPVDDEGLDVATGVRTAPRARLAVVTPAYQFPLGVTLSAARRTALLEWAAKNEAWIYEDDYDSEFRYKGRPIAALQGQDSHGRVIYAGSFSKVLLPSLRLGYIVVPENLVPVFTRAKLFGDISSPTLEQLVLADFLTQGHFARHVRRMRRIYGARQNVIVQHAAKELKGVLDVQPTHAGMHILGRLKGRFANNDIGASKAALKAGVFAAPLSHCRIKSKGEGGLVLGFAGATEKELKDGILKLKQALL